MAITALRRISNTIHKSRYDRAQQGMTLKQIAEEDGVSEYTVENSIRKVEIFRITCSPTEVEVRQAETLMVLADHEEAALQRCLTAKRLIFDDDGNKIGEEPDYPIQLEAVTEYNKKLEIVSGKKGGSGTTVNVNTAVGVLGSSVKTFEDRLREIQSKRALPQPAAVDTVTVDAIDAVEESDDPLDSI
jgi:hypothetical protein